MESSFPGTSVDIIPPAYRQNIAAIISGYRVCPGPVDTRPAQGHYRGMDRGRGVTVRGWAVWAAALAIVLLLNGVVWTLVVAY